MIFGLGHPDQRLRVAQDQLEDVIPSGESEGPDGGGADEHECPEGGSQDSLPDPGEHRHALGEDLTKRPGGYLHGPGYGNQPSTRSRACPSCQKWRSPGAIWRMR